MSNATTGFDVFLSYSAGDAVAGAVVRDTIREAGLTVFDMERPVREDTQWDAVRTALVGSEAFVYVAQHSAVPPNVAIEVGAAMAWLKPVLLVLDKRFGEQLPPYLRDFPTFELSNLGPLIKSIVESKAELNDAELEWLTEWYARHAQPLDQIVYDQRALGQLDSDFNQQFRRHIASAKLVQALLRLRKRGLLSTTRS